MSDVDQEIIIPDDESMNMTFFMLLYADEMYMGKRAVQYEILHLNEELICPYLGKLQF